MATSFAFLGDLTNHPVLMLEKPLMEFSYDTDPKQAAQSRLRTLTMLAANKVRRDVVSLRLAGLMGISRRRAKDFFH